MKKQSRLDVCKYSFSQRTITVWNHVSTDCVHAGSVNMFKNNIDKYLVKAGYTYSLCPNDGLPGNNCYQAIFGIKRSAIIFPIKWSKVLFDPFWENFFIS